METTTQNHLITIGAIALIIFAIWAVYKETSLKDTLTAPKDAPPVEGIVKNIIDGITIQLESGHMIRYLGVRTPLVSSQVQCFGQQAIAANEQIIGKKVRLEEDPVLLKSQDGAWVRYVYFTPDPTPTPLPTPTPEVSPTATPASVIDQTKKLV